MEAGILKMLFVVGVSAHFGKHVYVKDKRSWSEAQRYCRGHQTDLSPILSPEETELLRNATRDVDGRLWIGLKRYETQWKWSIGGDATNVSWSQGEPSPDPDQKCGAVCWHGECKDRGFHNRKCIRQHHFLCNGLIVKQQLVTWEQAMLRCNGTNTSLTSLDSKSENLLAQRLIQSATITERVWIGLRFLGDQWLWVNGRPLEYQAWGGEEDHQCPVWRRCGALTKEGVWENRDCQEQLNYMCYSVF